MTKSKELATKTETGLMFQASEDALKKMSTDSKDYQDDTNPDDLAIPRVRILQSTSGEVKKASPDRIEGAEEGDLFNTLNKKIYKENGIIFIPAKRRVVYLEWKDIKDGGGLVNNFGEDATAFLNSEIDEKGRRISAEGNEIVKTYDFFGYCLDANDPKKAEEVVISMAKSQSKKAKVFNSLIRSLNDSSTGEQLPEFAGAYHLTTVPESNDQGDWFSFNVSFAGYTLGIPEIGDKIYQRAKDLAKLVKENSVKAAAYENEVASDSRV